VDHHKAIRIRALAAVRRQDYDYHLRYVFRWYSRSFATPLHVVEALPLDDVLETFFECLYEHMDEHRLEDERRELMETDEEARRRRLAEDIAEAEDLEFQRKTEAEEAAREAAGGPSRQAQAGLREAVQVARQVIPPDMNIHFPAADILEGDSLGRSARD
jgi:hypothetical protein